MAHVRTNGDRTGPGPRQEAASRAAQGKSLGLRLPVVGQVALPPPAHVAWYGGVALLAAAEIIEWPVAVVLAVGKALADNRSSASLRQFGEALDEAG